MKFDQSILQHFLHSTVPHSAPCCAAIVGSGLPIGILHVHTYDNIRWTWFIFTVNGCCAHVCNHTFSALKDVTRCVLYKFSILESRLYSAEAMVVVVEAAAVESTTRQQSITAMGISTKSGSDSSGSGGGDPISHHRYLKSTAKKGYQDLESKSHMSRVTFEIHVGVSLVSYLLKLPQNSVCCSTVAHQVSSSRSQGEVLGIALYTVCG